MTALRILLFAPADALRNWPVTLAERLSADGHCVTLVLTEPVTRPSGLDALLALERILFRLPECAKPNAIARDEAMEAWDLAIDLTTAAPERRCATLKLLFDGRSGDEALVSALLDRRAPEVTLTFSEPGEAPCAIARARPALERPDLITPGLDAVSSAAVALLRRAVRRRSMGRPFDVNESWSSDRAAIPILATQKFAATMLVGKIKARLERLVRRPAHFRIGWRAISGDAIADTLGWPSSPYRFLPDDGARYYADPFICSRDGRRFVFCEEYPYATGKGVISVFEIGEDGAASTPRPAMEQAWHLSYPQVFERDGAIWMIPESSGARRLDLYRATTFPSDWRHEATLIDDLDISDATLCEHDGRLWLFATVAQDGLSSWDALHLFHSERLTGPWIAHPANPVLIEPSAARPAGACFERNGSLWRPAQNCARIYGGGLSLCEIEQLDKETFRQRVRVHLSPPHWIGGYGAHTLNAAAGVEVIDVLGARWRW